MVVVSVGRVGERGLGKGQVQAGSGGMGGRKKG